MKRSRSCFIHKKKQVIDYDYPREVPSRIQQFKTCDDIRAMFEFLKLKSNPHPFSSYIYNTFDLKLKCVTISFKKQFQSFFFE